MVKPDTRIYQILLKRYNLKAEECLFIDDNEKNIIAAKEMGIHGITLDQSDQIETYVNTYLEKTTC
ncbi:HAD-IA family hydrolase [Amedibacillus hominis]|uniref:HAD-IA family hydrolase n=1 Tax=Amedibacillus hominis TaxID=2897776 RepID=UPI00308440EA